MLIRKCPNCKSKRYVKSGFVKGKQRFKCKECNYHFTVSKTGKQIDAYYVSKALQLYLEGLTYREIERILGVSHVSVINWVKKYNIKRPEGFEYRSSHKMVNKKELIAYFSEENTIKNASVFITELGDRYMIIRWDRYK